MSKELGQVFTPDYIVKKIINLTEYNALSDEDKKSFLENQSIAQENKHRKYLKEKHKNKW